MLIEQCSVEWPYESGCVTMIRYATQRAIDVAEKAARDEAEGDIAWVIDALGRMLLPSGPDVPVDDRGWNLTDDGASVPISRDVLLMLPPDFLTTLGAAIFRSISHHGRRYAV